MSRVRELRSSSTIERPAVKLVEPRVTSQKTPFRIEQPQTENNTISNKVGEKTSRFYRQAIAKPLPMSVVGLNHFNITASPALVEQLKRFYVEVVGLKIGPRARLDHDGYWLYAQQSPILHLSARGNLAVEGVQKGYFNHISIGCVGLRSAIAKMQATQTPYRLVTVVDTGQTQLFLQDPAGIGVELTFFDESVSSSDSVSA